MAEGALWLDCGPTPSARLELCGHCRRLPANQVHAMRAPRRHTTVDPARCQPWPTEREAGSGRERAACAHQTLPLTARLGPCEGRRRRRRRWAALAAGRLGGTPLERCWATGTAARTRTTCSPARANILLLSSALGPQFAGKYTHTHTHTPPASLGPESGPSNRTTTTDTISSTQPPLTFTHLLRVSVRPSVCPCVIISNFFCPSGKLPP